MAKVVKAKVTKVQQAKRKSKGTEYPWEVWSIIYSEYHSLERECRTKKEAEKFIKENPGLIAPVIVHINISSMEY